MILLDNAFLDIAGLSSSGDEINKKDIFPIFSHNIEKYVKSVLEKQKNSIEGGKYIKYLIKNKKLSFN